MKIKRVVQASYNRIKVVVFYSKRGIDRRLLSYRESISRIDFKGMFS